MKFCDNCNNMLYFSVEGDNLKYYCKNCNFSVIDNFAAKAECVLESHHTATKQGNYRQFMNKNIKYDPTLPRVNNIDCPSCTTKPNEVIYMKYDPVEMKYLYFCCHCENFWR